jgi:hypothetical protein
MRGKQESGRIPSKMGTNWKVFESKSFLHLMVIAGPSVVRRSSASTSSFGSVNKRSRRVTVKSSKSPASCSERLPTCAPSFLSSRTHFANSRKLDGRTPLSNNQGRRRPKSLRCLLLGSGFVVSTGSGSNGRVANFRAKSIPSEYVYFVAERTREIRNR